MKFTNLSKLWIKFIGGGLVNFPTRYLKEVEVEAEGGESDGEGSGNNDELLLKTKQLIADYGSKTFGSGTDKYTVDNVELPDAYIYFDDVGGILYDCSLEAVYISGQPLIPLYLKSRNIKQDSIVFRGKMGCSLRSNVLDTPLDLIIGTFPDGTVNNISININDYIAFGNPPM